MIGKRKIKGRPSIRFSLGPGAAAVAVNDPAHVRQADARALKLRRAMEPLKDTEKLAGVFHVEADAVVLHEHDDFRLGTLAADLDDCRLAVTGVFQRV